MTMYEGETLYFTLSVPDAPEEEDICDSLLETLEETLGRPVDAKDVEVERDEDEKNAYGVCIAGLQTEEIYSVRCILEGLPGVKILDEDDNEEGRELLEAEDPADFWKPKEDDDDEDRYDTPALD